MIIRSAIRFRMAWCRCSTAPTGLGNNLGNSLSTMLRSQRTPTTYNFNFGLEYELPHQVVLSAGYVGSRGLFLPLGAVDLNDLDLAPSDKTIRSASSTARTAPMVANQWAAIQPATNATMVRRRFLCGSRCSSIRSSATAIMARQRRDCARIPRRRLRVQLTANEGAEATDAALHYAGEFYLGQAHDRRRQSSAGFCGCSPGLDRRMRRTSHLEHSVSPQDVKYQFTGDSARTTSCRPRAVR